MRRGTGHKTLYCKLEYLRRRKEFDFRTQKTVNWSARKVESIYPKNFLKLQLGTFLFFSLFLFFLNYFSFSSARTFHNARYAVCRVACRIKSSTDSDEKLAFLCLRVRRPALLSCIETCAHSSRRAYIGLGCPRWLKKLGSAGDYQLPSTDYSFTPGLVFCYGLPDVIYQKGFQVKIQSMKGKWGQVATIFVTEWPQWYKRVFLFRLVGASK